MHRCLLSPFLLTGLSLALNLIIALALTLTLTLTPSSSAHAQTPWSVDVEAGWLQQVLPQATHFSEKAGEPPVYRGYRDTELVGLVFRSRDVPPEETGYSAPIDMLIGMNPEGHITGLKLLDYRESYRSTRGDFLNNTAFLFQFRNKHMNDGFRPGRDINGLASATVSTWAIARGVRNATRRVALAHLDIDEEAARQQQSDANARELLAAMSWQELLDTGAIKTLHVPLDTPEASELVFYVTYVGKDVLGEFMVGTDAWSLAERGLTLRTDGGEMMLVAISGGTANQFRQERLTVQQGNGEPQTIDRRQFVYAGNASDGMLAGHARFAGAIVLDSGIDVTAPLSIGYRPIGSDAHYSVDFTLSGLGLDLARGNLILSDEERLQAMLADAGVFTRLRHDPPWGQTPWLKTGILLLILALVMAAFLRKSAALRWTALGTTLVYLGFIDGGFVSVSHITDALSQGPGIFLNNLPLLIIVSFTLVTTLIWGRVFCSSLCPFGAVQDIISRLVPIRWRRLQHRWQRSWEEKGRQGKGWLRGKLTETLHKRALWLKYGFLAVIVIAAIGYSEVSIFQYFEPFGTLFFFSGSALLWAILALVLLGSIFIRRFYCRYACPLGAALGLLSLLSPLRIKRVPQCSICKVCEQACPTGAIRGADIDFKECVRCDICESKLITAAGVCRHDMDDLTRRHKDWQTLNIMPTSAAPAATTK